MNVVVEKKSHQTPFSSWDKIKNTRMQTLIVCVLAKGCHVGGYRLSVQCPQQTVLSLSVARPVWQSVSLCCSLRNLPSLDMAHEGKTIGTGSGTGPVSCPHLKTSPTWCLRAAAKHATQDRAACVPSAGRVFTKSRKMNTPKLSSLPQRKHRERLKICTPPPSITRPFVTLPSLLLCLPTRFVNPSFQLS